jgi:hypothetical protein
LNGVILDPDTPCSAISIGSVAKYIWQSAFYRKTGPRFHGIVKEIVKPYALVKESAQQVVTDNLPKPDAKIVFGYDQQPSLTNIDSRIPFVTAVQKQHSLIKRGVPYLRHSWSRIDFVAIVGFWITFALSVTGVERVATSDTASLVRHIGVFRALSVLRCARLLAVTDGTTVGHFLLMIMTLDSRCSLIV